MNGFSLENVFLKPPPMAKSIGVLHRELIALLLMLLLQLMLLQQLMLMSLSVDVTVDGAVAFGCCYS